MVSRPGSAMRAAAPPPPPPTPNNLTRPASAASLLPGRSPRRALATTHAASSPMLVKLPKPFSAGTSANEVSKANLVPLLRFGPRQLAGVDGLYHLKQLGAVAGKAAAVTTTEARTVQSSAQLPRATRPYMRPMRAAYMPTSVLLRKPAARKPQRKGVDWQLRVLTDAAQCFEDVAAADRVGVAEKYRAPPPQPQPPRRPPLPS